MMRTLRIVWLIGCLILLAAARSEAIEDKRSYRNDLKRLKIPPLLADHPEFFEPITEQAHFERRRSS
jgi:hypothetical protein